jgi:hypothetical protein
VAGLIGVLLYFLRKRACNDGSLDHLSTSVSSDIPSRNLMETSIRSLKKACWEDEDIAICIATRYGMDGPEIESRWERHFPYLLRTALEPTPPPVREVTYLFLGGKGAGALR